MQVQERGLEHLTLLIVGQTVALLGTRFIAFGLGIWAYQQAGAVTDLAMIILAATIPAAILSPLAGSLVDRWNRKMILLVARAMIAVMTTILALLFWQGILEVWHIAIIVMIQALFAAVVKPAINASVVLMVKKDELSKANGMMGLSNGIVSLIAPLIAGALLTSFGMKVIFLLNIPTIAIGILTLIVTHIPQPPNHSKAINNKESLFSSMAFGWNYLKARRGLLLVMLFSSNAAFTIGALNVLIIPLVLGFTDATGLGIINSISGSGMIVGSVLVLRWGGPTRKVFGILGAGAIFSVACILAPILPSIIPVAFGGFVMMCCFPVMAVCGQELYQRKVAAEVQGRIFGLQAFVLGVSTPLSIVTVAPLVDKVFDPLMAANGAWAPYLAPIYGTGEARGAAVLLSILGMISLLWIGVAALSNTMRRVDLDLPDLTNKNEAG